MISVRLRVSAPQSVMLSLQQMISQGRLKAYHINNHAGTIVLFPVERLDERQSFVIEDIRTKTKYLFDMQIYGGLFYNEGEGQTVHYSLALRRLPKKFPESKLVSRYYSGRRVVFLEEKCVEAELRLEGDNDWELTGEVDDIAASISRQEARKGQDRLFDELLAYIKR